MEDKIKFPANVILIDVAFLNEVVYGAKNFLEGKLGRKLPDVDLPAWLSYLALDAGLREQENEVEVLLVHTPAADVLKCCEPSDVNKLNHQACRTPLGEFAFSSVTSSGLVSTEELFLDLMNLALDSADVKCLVVGPFHQVYGNGVEEKSCRIAAYFFIHSLFYEKFNDVLRHQVQKIICTDFDRKKRKAVVFGFFGVGNGNVKYFFDCSFFLFYS